MPKFHFNRGYISIALIVFLLFVAFFVFPRTYPKPVPQKGCVAGDEPAKQKLIDLPEIINIEKDVSRPPFDKLSYSPGENSAKYKLIRKDTPIWKDPVLLRDGDQTHRQAADQEHYRLLDPDFQIPGDTDGKHYAIYFPSKFGELDIDHDFKPFSGYNTSNNNDPSKKVIRMAQEGLVYLVQLDDKGEEIKTQALRADLTLPGNPLTDQDVVKVDIYQLQAIADDPNRDYKYEEMLKCNNEIAPSKYVTVPNQDSSKDKSQLQLEWILFKGGGAVNAHCKPAIYLYPPKPEMVNVKVTPSGFLTYVDPPYDSDKGWNVLAHPDGVLTINDKRLTNNYLYFESKIRDSVIKKPTEGWVVKMADLENLYKDTLPKLGLNAEQTSDFIQYWQKALPDSPYYFVGVIDSENVNQIEKLDITPKPDSINRVRIYFERLDSPKDVIAPSLTASYLLPAANDSFRVVEWGGMVKNDPNHPFTCSQ